jgi:hypothetical protein
MIMIPESGILITPEQGEVLSLLRRDRQLGEENETRFLER